MIYFVTSRTEMYTFHKFSHHDIVLQDDPTEFIDWIDTNEVLQLDTETPVIGDGPTQHEDRTLLVIQFGDIDEEVQYVIDMISLSDEWIEAIKYALTSNIMFISHNVKFEYIVIKSNLGVSIENLHDTYLMSKIANTGLELMPGYHSLDGCLRRFFNITIDKESQTSFNGDPLTIKQILYGAADVTKLAALFIKLKDILKSWNLYYLYYEIERHVVKVYSDMELTPMRIDMKYWGKLAQSFIQEAGDIEKELDDTVVEDPKLVAKLKRSEKVLGLNLIQPADEYKMNWASTTFKKDAFSVLAPDLPDTVKTKPAIKKFLKENRDDIPMEQSNILDLYMSRSYDKIDELLINNHKKFLEENMYFVPEDTLLINWASNKQRLYIFNFYYPKLDDTNAKTLIRIKKNKLINKYKEWTKANKNVTSYGEGFAHKYVKPNDTIAPFGLNQILSTGRISFGILLQMPAKTNKFRNAFLPPGKDDVFVDTDYSSMEVLIAAHAAGENSFLEAIRKGKDLHSMSASMLFKDKWIEMAELDCEHLKTGKRCKCEEHNKFRDFSKAVTFGLFYGISAYGLAERLDIPQSEAQDIVNRFFEAFPKFKQMFDENEEFAIENEYIRGLNPVNRVRFFLHPTHGGEEGAIGRAAKNFPIQEFNASILKIALIRLRDRIIKNNLPYKIHLPIHDEILSSCHKDDADDLKALQEEIMLEVADEFIAPNLCSVDTKILTRWEK